MCFDNVKKLKKRFKEKNRILQNQLLPLYIPPYKVIALLVGNVAKVAALHETLGEEDGR